VADHPNPKGSALSADADTWALLSATVMALLILGLAFSRQVTIGLALIRSGLGFVVTYATVFLLVRFALRVALRELAAEAVERRHARQRRQKQSSEGGPGEAGPGEE
jgi:membrane protein implicated in regulation of membrane protease activity